MNSSSETLEAPHSTIPPPWVFSKPVVAESGLDGDLLHLGPKAECPLHAIARQRALFVVAGAVTITDGETHFMLGADGVLPIAPGRVVALRNHGDQPAKVLSLLLPEPRVEWRLFVPGESAVA